MVGANAAVVRAAVHRFGMGFARVFAGLVVIAYLFVILYIGGDKHFLKTMFLTGFGKVHIAAFKNYFGVYLPVAFNAKAYGVVVVNVTAFVFHMFYIVLFFHTGFGACFFFLCLATQKETKKSQGKSKGASLPGQRLPTCKSAPFSQLRCVMCLFMPFSFLAGELTQFIRAYRCEV
jgi:hypothetical protein